MSASAYVSRGAQVQLLGPTFGGVEAGEEQHHEGRELDSLVLFDWLTVARFRENGCGRALRAWRGVAIVQSVVGEAAAYGVEGFMPLFQGLKKTAEIFDVSVCGLRKSFDPRQEVGSYPGSGVVRGKRGENFRPQT